MGNGRTKKNNSGETHAEALNRLGIVELTDPWGQKQFRTANKEAHVAPKIERTYFDEDNVRMYECEGGRLFVADTYDERFTPTHGKRMFKAK